VVNWDGGYAPCCYLTDASDDFGEVNTQSIKEIWNNEQYMTARGLFKDRFAPNTYVGCLNCNVYLESKVARKRGPVIHLEPLRPAQVMVNGKGNKPRQAVG
jgi:hypothetical protein